MTRCYTDDYNTYAGAAWFAGVLYAVGVPAVFMLLINKFKHHGRRGDKLVQKVLGWMYRPFRPGKEWWLGVARQKLVADTRTVPDLALLLTLLRCVLLGSMCDRK